MDEEDMKTGLTEADIRQLAGEQSFKWGILGALHPRSLPLQ
ncbi:MULTISPECIES: hypothetical protein [Moorella (nom. illeg.)]|nr:MULTISPECIES: hypothetical protein [Moorella]